MRPRRSHRGVTTALVAIALGGLAACGPTPPQAPLAEAKKLEKATGGISTACGEAYEVTAFPGDHRRDLARLEATATSQVRVLASVYARNPAWIYQSETVRKIVQDAATALRSCGLGQAAVALEQATSRR